MSCATWGSSRSRAGSGACTSSSRRRSNAGRRRDGTGPSRRSSSSWAAW